MEQPASFAPDDFTIQRLSPSRLLVPEVEQAIENNWTELRAQSPCDHLFDGGLWRCVRHRIRGTSIELSVEPTSFKVYKGTNIDNPELFKTHGDAVMAHPLVVNAFIQTNDKYFLFARRSERVAIFPRRIYVIGGSVRRTKDSLTGQELFDTMYDELQEELDIHRSEVNSLRCVGISIAAPHRMRQVVFAADVALSSSEVSEQDPIDRYEHDEWLFVPANSDALSEFSREFDEQLTPAVRSWLEGNLRDW